MMENIKAYLAAGYPVSYVLMQLSQAAARVAKGFPTDGNCSDMECELYVELQKAVPKFLVEFSRDGRTWVSEESFTTRRAAEHHGAFHEREDRYGTLRFRVMTLQFGELAEAA